MKHLRLAALFCVSVACGGCFQMTTIVRLNGDGSGTIEHSMLITKAALAQIRQFSALGGRGQTIDFVSEEQAKKMTDSLYEETRQLLEANRDRIDAIAKALIRYETLDSNDIDRIMRGDNLTKPTMADLLEKEGRRGTVIAPSENPATDPDVRPGFGGGPLPSPG